MKPGLPFCLIVVGGNKQKLKIRDKNFIIIVGAPRSGTTWLANMINAHPDVAGIDRELKTFNSYIKPIHEAWKNETFRIEEGYWEQGHPLIWSQEEFDSWVEEFLEKTYKKILSKNVNATHILDKHPGYVFALEEIIKYIPHVKIIHVVRDPRDVVTSIVSAKKRMGFGRDNIRDASILWRNSIESYRKFKNIKPDIFLEVKYEDLRRDNELELAGIFKFLGLSNDPQINSKIVENFSYSNNVLSKPDPEFEKMRNNNLQVWNVKLNVWEKKIIQIILGKYMFEYNYEVNNEWVFKSKIDRLKLIYYTMIFKIKFSK